MKYFVLEENILSIEQPFVFEFGDDKMVLMENVGTFILPQRLFERVDVWVHEFVEQTLIKKILELDGASEYSVYHGNHSIPELQSQQRSGDCTRPGPGNWQGNRNEYRQTDTFIAFDDFTPASGTF